MITVPCGFKVRLSSFSAAMGSLTCSMTWQSDEEVGRLVGDQGQMLDRFVDRDVDEVFRLATHERAVRRLVEREFVDVRDMTADRHGSRAVAGSDLEARPSRLAQSPWRMGHVSVASARTSASEPFARSGLEGRGNSRLAVGIDEDRLDAGEQTLIVLDGLHWALWPNAA